MNGAKHSPEAVFGERKIHKTRRKEEK